MKIKASDSAKSLRAVATEQASSETPIDPTESGSTSPDTTLPPPQPSAQLTVTVQSGQASALNVDAFSPRATLALTIANAGDADSESLVGKVQVTGGFVITNQNCGGILTPKSTCSVTITGEGTHDGALTGSFYIDLDGAPKLPLAGTISGFYPVLQLTAAGSATALDLHTTSPGATKVVTVRNSGAVATSALHAASLSGAGASHFTLVSDACAGQILSPAETCELAVKPTSAVNASYAASLDLSDGLVTGSVALSGSASGFFEIMVVDTANKRIRRFDSATRSLNALAGSVPNSNEPTDLLDMKAIATDTQGNIYFIDPSCVIRVLAKTSRSFFGTAVVAGKVQTIAGRGVCEMVADGTPARAGGVDAKFIRLDAVGNLYFSGGGASAFSGSGISVIAATDGVILGKAVEAGKIYRVAGDGADGYAGDGGPAVMATLASGGASDGFALDSHGNLFIADRYNGRVRVVAAADGTIFGVAVTAGNIYTVMGDRGSIARAIP